MSRFAGVALGFYALLAAAALAWLHHRGGGPPIARPATWLADLGLGVGAAVLLLGAWSLGSHWSQTMRDLEDHVRDLVGALRPDEVLLVAGASGLVEELFFRGAMLPSWGFWVSTLVFGLLHTGPGAAFKVWTIFALLAGALFGGLVVWRGTLLAPIVAHVLVNGIQLWRLAGREREAASGDDADA